jgi:hypothetical protein
MSEPNAEYVRVGVTDCPTCGHDADEHAGGHGDDRLDPCMVDGCACRGPFSDDPDAAQLTPLVVPVPKWGGVIPFHLAECLECSALIMDHPQSRANHEAWHDGADQ